MRHGNSNGISNEEHFLKSFKGNTSDLTTGFPLIKEARQKLGMDLRKTPRGRTKIFSLHQALALWKSRRADGWQIWISGFCIYFLPIEIV